MQTPSVHRLHRVWRVGADIDTDQLAPGAYMKLGIERIAPHCLESVRPEFAANVKLGDVLVAGPNFGIGSSREQAAAALVTLGISAVIAPSFSGLFFRNAFNVGLLLMTCERADEIGDAEDLGLDLNAWQIHRKNGTVLACSAVPDFLMDIVRAGGLLNHLKSLRGACNSAAT